jgi:ubiquitin carboxyl-terminal hydrolase L5
LVNKQPPVLDVGNPADLAEFNLRPSDFESAVLGETVKARISRAASDSEQAWALYEQFVVDLKVAIGEYRAEIISLAVDEQRVKDRKKDYGQALHRWVQKLAEKGVLQEMIENS